MAPRDPRFRPYRAALWAVYFLVILVPIGLLVASVARHLWTPRASPGGPLPTRASLRVCVQELEALHREQNRRAWALGEEVGKGEPVARFLEWSAGFERRVADLADRCHLPGGSAEGPGFRGEAELSRARDAVLSLHRAYRAQANRFAQEEAQLAASAAAALGAARDAARQQP